MRRYSDTNATATEHPDDRQTRNRAVAEAKHTIGPYWRANWQRFVALVQTWSDAHAHELLDTMREEFWGSDNLRGGPPTPPGAET